MCAFPLLTILQTFDSVPPSERTLVTCQMEEILLKHRRTGKKGFLSIYTEDIEIIVSVKGVPAEVKTRVTIGPTGIMFVPDEMDLVSLSKGNDTLPYLKRAKVHSRTWERYVMLIVQAHGSRCTFRNTGWCLLDIYRGTQIQCEYIRGHSLYGHRLSFKLMLIKPMFRLTYAQTLYRRWVISSLKILKMKWMLSMYISLFGRASAHLDKGGKGEA